MKVAYLDSKLVSTDFFLSLYTVIWNISASCKLIFTRFYKLPPHDLFGKCCQNVSPLMSRHTPVTNKATHSLTFSTQCVIREV